MYLLATIGLGLVLAASVYSFMWGVASIIRKRPRGAIAALFGFGLCATYILLTGVTAYLLGTAHAEGTTLEPENKARILAEGIAMLMNTTVLGAPLGLLLAVVAIARSRRAAAPQ